MGHDQTSPLRLPREPIQKLSQPFLRFLHIEAASGVILLLCTVVALGLANSPASDWFLGIWKTKFAIGFGAEPMSHSLKHWINDGLMAVFFFVIGLEVKRELVMGELRDMKRAALPIAAAFGGMVVPAGIYLALQWGEPGQPGWGIPMATDIAFVVGCLAVLGRRIPPSLRVLLLSLAIADDIGAILVIAVGYTEQIGWTALILGLSGVLLVALLARLGVRSIGIYLVVAVVIWLAFHESGIHATIAGVILGLQTPSRAWVTRGIAAEAMQKASQVLTGTPDADRVTLERASLLAKEAVSPLVRLETLLHPWMGFAIMPIFALANAGVAFEVSDFADPIALAVATGLLLGKPIGIVLFSFLAVRLGIAHKPDRISWGALAGGGLLAGIGFTMALFISGLALQGDALDAAKVGVLGGSLVAAVLGVGVLLLTLPKPDAETGAG